MTRTLPARCSLFRGLASITIVLLAVTLGGCDRSPTNDALISDLAAYVDTGYAPGLMDVVRVERLDHRMFPDFASDNRTVAYTADLRLKRDYDFGAWDQANAATLMQLLGTRAQDLLGLKGGGNKAGDVVHVTGALAYVRTGQQWHLKAGAASRLDSKSVLPPQSRLALLQQWARVTAMTARALVAPASAVLTDELSATVKAASARLARQNGGLAVASGPADEDYWNVSDAIVKAGNAPGRPMINVTTQGALENLRLLSDGAVTAVILRGDEAVLAAKGEGPFEHAGTFPDLRALAGLFPEALHVVVMGTSPIASVADLFGKRVTIVRSGTAAAQEAGDILRAHRVALAALAATPDELPIDAALAALKRGERDAVILTAPAPSLTLRDFAVANAVRFLPLDADAVALLTTGTSSYVAVTVPAQTYPGQGRPIVTVGVATLLVSSAQVAPAEAEVLLQRVFADFDFMRSGSPFSAMMRVASARRGVTLPLHEGAEAFYGAISAQK